MEIWCLIEVQDIGPRFLAYVTENRDRIIGYMVEMVKARRATTDDLPACRHVLSKPHGLGIAHGPFQDTNFLVANDGGVLFHNFPGFYKTDKKDVLDMKMEDLEGMLRNAADHPDGQPQKIGSELFAEIRAISLRDDSLHSLLWDQAFRKGKITISPEEHKEMLDDLRKNGWKKA